LATAVSRRREAHAVPLRWVFLPHAPKDSTSRLRSRRSPLTPEQSRNAGANLRREQLLAEEELDPTPPRGAGPARGKGDLRGKAPRGRSPGRIRWFGKERGQRKRVGDRVYHARWRCGGVHARRPCPVVCCEREQCGGSCNMCSIAWWSHPLDQPTGARLPWRAAGVRLPCMMIDCPEGCFQPLLSQYDVIPFLISPCFAVLPSGITEILSITVL
jgi:hypothetical protein